MSNGSTINYDALAAKYGATQTPSAPAVDYDALAQKHGAVQSSANAAAQPDDNIGSIHKAWNWLWGVGPQYEHQGLVEQFQHAMERKTADIDQRMQKGTDNTVTDAEQGNYSTEDPNALGAERFAASSLADVAKTERGMASPGNMAAGVAAAVVPPLRAPIGAYYAIKGAADALTPQQPQESQADAVQRRLMGAATTAGGVAGFASGLPRKAYIPDYETWRDGNFAKNDSGQFEGQSGASYSEAQLQAMHKALSQQLVNTPFRSLFSGASRDLGEYSDWLNDNFRPSDSVPGKFEAPDGRLYSQQQLQTMYDARASVQTSVAQGLQQAIKSPAGAIRNNPVTNTVIGPNPEALPADAAFIKATKPRNSIQNINDHVNRALPDARRALDALGIDPAGMTLKDAEAAVFQAKKDVWSEFENNHLNPNAETMVDTTPVAQKIQAVGDRMSPIQQRRMPGIVQDIENNAADYDGQQMSVGDIEDRIQELNNQLRSQQATLYFTTNPRVHHASSTREKSISS